MNSASTSAMLDGARVARALAYSAILLTVPSVIGWAFAMPQLVQPLEGFAPARLWGTVMIPAGALGMLADIRSRQAPARAWALLCGCAALLGLVASMVGVSLPFDDYAWARISDAPILARGIPISIGLLFSAYSIGLYVLARREPTERSLLMVGALAAVMLAMATVLMMAQLAGLVSGETQQGIVRAPLHGVLAAMALAVALLLRVARHEGVTLAPPKWAPILAGTTAAMVVLVIWQALASREESDARARAALATRAVALAAERQFSIIERAIARTAVYGATIEDPDDRMWVSSLPQMVRETAGLSRLLWLDSTGMIRHVAPDSAVASAVLPQVAEAARDILSGLRYNTDTRRVAQLHYPRSSGLSRVPWGTALSYPILSRTMGNSVVIGLVDETALLNEFVREVSGDFIVGVLRGDSLISGSRVSSVAHESLLLLGAQQYRMVAGLRAGVSRSTLPELVLVLGLTVAALLALTLWLQRRSWTAASEEGVARMQRVIDRATDGVWEVDVLNGRTHRSPALLRSLGFGPAQLQDGFAGWLVLVHPDDRAIVNDAFTAHLRGVTEAFECKYRLQAGDGSWHVLVDRGVIVERTADGRPSRLLGISADVTERAHADAARDESERRFRAIFDTAYQLQMLLDLDGSILEANRAAAELAAMPIVGAMQGVLFWEVPWWNDQDGSVDRVQERFVRARGGETTRFEVGLGTGAERRTIDFSLKPIYDADELVVQVLAEGRDLTLRKRAQESLREIGALTTMGQLAARVAHEINNPLAGIQNAFLLIRDAIPLDHPHYRFVGAIEREISRIAAVTRQLYETYRPDEHTVSQSSVVLAVSDAVSFLEQVNRVRHVAILTDMTRAPSMVPVPDALLRQTLYNLVQNALDASPVNGTMTVSATQEGDECVIRVADEGPGIPAALRDRIFDPFFSTKDRTIKTGGMGIGLALVRQSVLAVGGRIDVQDRPGGGTIFEVRLPMTPLDTGVLQ